MDIQNEYRFFIADKSIVASSLYVSRDSGDFAIIYDGAKAEDETELQRVTDFMNDALPILNIPDGVVIDVATTSKGEILILEANPAWCSGWYDADIDGVVEAIEKSCQNNPLWKYEPDSFLVEHYRKYPKLKTMS